MIEYSNKIQKVKSRDVCAPRAIRNNLLPVKNYVITLPFLKILVVNCQSTICILNKLISVWLSSLDVTNRIMLNSGFGGTRSTTTIIIERCRETFSTHVKHLNHHKQEIKHRSMSNSLPTAWLTFNDFSTGSDQCATKCTSKWTYLQM